MKVQQIFKVIVVIHVAWVIVQDHQNVFVNVINRIICLAMPSNIKLFNEDCMTAMIKMKDKQLTDLQFYHEQSIYSGAKNTVEHYERGGSLLFSGGEQEGVGIAKKPQDGYKVMYPDGYISWSPKEQFEIAYREVTDSERNFLI